MTEQIMTGTADKMDRLQEIMDSLPSSNRPGPEQRKNALTKRDVLVIYNIAKIANEPHICPFKGEDISVLTNVATNITRTQKLVAVTLIVGSLGAIGRGLWLVVTYAVRQYIANGGVNIH
jgi:hypothetical protein